MTRPKVAVTLSQAVLDAVKGKVASGEAASVSAYVEAAVQASLMDSAETEWQLLVQEVLEETGGPITPEETARIHRELGISE